MKNKTEHVLLLRVLIRCWRRWFTATKTYSTTTQNCKMPWFGFTFTQTFQNSTRWNVGAHWRKRQHPQVGSRRRGWQFHSHAKKNANVAFHRLRWALFSGLNKFPAAITNLVMGLGPNKIYKQPNYYNSQLRGCCQIGKFPVYKLNIRNPFQCK